MKKSIFIVPIIIILAVYLGFTFWAINAAPEKPAYVVEEAYGATANGAEFYTVNLSRIPTGSTDQLLGSYEVENTIYTFDPEKGIVRIMKDSSYDVGNGTIQLDNEQYTITKNGTDYTLTSGTKNLPLKFLGGDNGLANGTANFSGTYESGNHTGYIFTDNGKVTIVDKYKDFVPNEDGSFTYGGTKYTWNFENGKLVLKAEGGETTTLTPMP